MGKAKNGPTTIRDVTEADDRVSVALSGLSTDDRIHVLRRSLRRLEDEQERDPKNLEARFESQLKRLRYCGVPPYMVSILRDRKAHVLAMAKEIGIGCGAVPFLPVIPFRYLCLHAQTAMVTKAVRGDRYLFDPSRLADRQGEMARLVPYYVFGIGTDTSAADRQERRGLTVAEALATAIHGCFRRPLVTDAVVSFDGASFRPVVIPDKDTPLVVDIRERLDDPTALVPTCLRVPGVR